MVLGDSYSYYDVISYEERGWYDSLYSSVLSRSNCTLYGANPEQAANIYKAVVLDHPELIYHSGLLSRLQPTNAGIIVHINYSDSVELEYEEAFGRISQRLYNKLYNLSDYEKYKAIFEYIAGTVEYDTDVFEDYMELSVQRSRMGHIGNQMTPADSEYARSIEAFMQRNSSSFTPYGVFVNGKAVCMGIAKAFKVLCDYFGLPCICVEARDKERNVEHLLNMVQIDGKSAFVDATFGLAREEHPMYNYDIFLATREVVDKYYNLTYDFECDGEELSYHARNGLIFDNVSDLRSYLEAYNAELNDNAVRARYVGDLMDDNELEDFAIEILNYHLSSKHRLKSRAKTKNGFINILIGDR